MIHKFDLSKRGRYVIFIADGVDPDSSTRLVCESPIDLIKIKEISIEKLQQIAEKEMPSHRFVRFVDSTGEVREKPDFRKNRTSGEGNFSTEGTVFENSTGYLR